MNQWNENGMNGRKGGMFLHEVLLKTESKVFAKHPAGQTLDSITQRRETLESALTQQGRDMLTIDRFPAERGTHAHGQARGGRGLEIRREHVRNLGRIFIRREESRVVQSQRAQGRNVRAEGGQVAKRGFEQRDAEALFAAGEEERIRHAIKIGDDFIGQKSVHEFSEKMRGMLQAQLSAKIFEVLKVLNIISIVRTERTCHNQRGLRKLFSQFSQRAQGQFDILARRHAHRQQQNGRGVQ